jgi:hypothetical protein
MHEITAEIQNDTANTPPPERSIMGNAFRHASYRR